MKNTIMTEEIRDDLRAVREEKNIITTTERLENAQEFLRYARNIVCTENLNVFQNPAEHLDSKDEKIQQIVYTCDILLERLVKKQIKMMYPRHNSMTITDQIAAEKHFEEQFIHG